METSTVFYGDESYFEGTPEEIVAHDPRNVQAIMFVDLEQENNKNCGRIVLASHDFYIYSDVVGCWHPTSNIHDLIDHLSLGCGPGGVRAVLTGRWIDTDLFKRILTMAETHGDLPHKSAYKTGFIENARRIS